MTIVEVVWLVVKWLLCLKKPILGFWQELAVYCPGHSHISTPFTVVCRRRERFWAGNTMPQSMLMSFNVARVKSTCELWWEFQVVVYYYFYKKYIYLTTLEPHKHYFRSVNLTAMPFPWENLCQKNPHLAWCEPAICGFRVALTTRPRSPAKVWVVRCIFNYTDVDDNISQLFAKCLAVNLGVPKYLLEVQKSSIRIRVFHQYAL